MNHILIGKNASGKPLYLTPEMRQASHMHVIGGTRTGKSKFLEWMMRKDIREGHGFALGERQDFVAQADVWRTALRPKNLDTPPGDVASESRSEGFYHGFLAGEPTREVLVLAPLAQAVRLLGRREERFDRTRVRGDEPSDALDPDDVDTDLDRELASRLRPLHARQPCPRGSGR